MKRRAGGQLVKARRRKAVTLKHRTAPKAVRRHGRSAGNLQEQLDLRTRELNEALDRQTATSEVLQVISSSPGDVEPVFATMLENAARICGAKFGNIFRWDGDALHLVATHNTPPAFAEARRSLPLRPNKENPIGRVLATRTVIHVADLAGDERYTERRDPDVIAAVELGGIRTFVAVPMLKENNLIGALIVYRQEVRPFTDKQIELVKNFAAQAVIAIENARLLSELRQRTAELTESLEQQTATSEVLQVISSSPGDLEPVFEAMLEKAVRICDAKYGTLYLRDGGTLRLVAAHDVPEFFAARRGVAFEPAPGGGLDVVMRTKRAAQVPDLAATTAYKERHAGMVEAVELAGIRTGMAVPMLKEDELIGIVAIHRREVLLFTDKQLALITNFAAQAVIAIENTRLLSELRESLQEQTATSEVLQVISSSPGDLQPVFATMLGKAVGICDATFGNIYRWDGEALQLIATHNTPPAYAEHRKHSPFRAGQNNAVAQMIVTKKLVHVLDAAANETYATRREPTVVAAVELGKIRSSLVVPMLKEEELIGAFIVSRQEVRPFTEKQIALVTNFAAQAVIAIENARLLNELRQRTTDLGQRTEELTESLEQQTATSEVLQVISRSTFDLQTVLDTLTESAVRLCSADNGVIFQRDGDLYRPVPVERWASSNSREFGDQ